MSQTVPSGGPPPAPGSLRALFARAERFVFESHPLAFVGFVVVVLVAKNGVGTDPRIGLLVKIADAYPHPAGLNAGNSYLLGSPIQFAIPKVLGATSRAGFVAVHATVLACWLAVLFAGSYRVAGRVGLGIVATLLLCSPLSNIELTWFGLEDPFTLLFLTLAVLFDGPLVALLAGFGAGVSHYQVAVLGVLWVQALRWCDDRDSVRSPATVALLIGLLLGAAVTTFVDVQAGVGADPRSTFLHFRGLGPLINLLLGDLPVWLVSVFGLWWVVLCVLWRRYAFSRSAALVNLLGLIGAAAVTAGTADETRVFSLITWAPLLWFAVRFARSLNRGERRLLTAIFVAATVVPQVVVWSGMTFFTRNGP